MKFLVNIIKQQNILLEESRQRMAIARALGVTVEELWDNNHRRAA